MANMRPPNGDPTVYSKITSLVAGMGNFVPPHHPLLCHEWYAKWQIGEDGMACKHAEVGILDEKLQGALAASICELLIEFAWDFKGIKNA